MTTAIDDRPVHLYFGRELDELKLTPELLEKIDSMSRKVYICKSWSDLPEHLKKQPKSICFSHTELEYSSAMEIVNMVQTLSKLVGLAEEIKIAVGVGADLSYDQIKLLQKSGVHGIIPRSCDFGWDECEKGAAALWAGIPYWPKHIVDRLPGARPKKAVTGKLPDIRLTARQEQILRLVVERGVSNKIIARTLNIGESTVKLHLGNIFRKYGVKNRTQLALFAQHRKNKKDGMDLPLVD